jgi:TonB family protein
MLSSVVSQVPTKNAVLAPQPVKKAVEAKLLRTVSAQYPQMARQLRVEGEVLLKIDIDTSGNVAVAHALSGPPMLRQAAIDAVEHWKYQPATLGDKPVASSQAVKVDFHLH